LLIGGIVMWIIDAMKAPWEQAGPHAPGSPIHTWKMDDIHAVKPSGSALARSFRLFFPVLRAPCRRSPVDSWRNVARRRA